MIQQLRKWKDNTAVQLADALGAPKSWVDSVYRKRKSLFREYFSSEEGELEVKRLFKVGAFLTIVIISLFSQRRRGAK